jgi:hypothetical protein
MFFGLIGDKKPRLRKYSVRIHTHMMDLNSCLDRVFFVENLNAVLEEATSAFKLLQGEKIEKITIAELSNK